jgi:hypothetical protein
VNEQLLFGKGGLLQPTVARRDSPGDFANGVRTFSRTWALWPCVSAGTTPCSEYLL